MRRTVDRDLHQHIVIEQPKQACCCCPFYFRIVVFVVILVHCHYWLEWLEPLLLLLHRVSVSGVGTVPVYTGTGMYVADGGWSWKELTPAGYFYR